MNRSIVQTWWGHALLLLSMGLCATAAQASLKLSPMFQDHAVLQRDMPVPVWGVATAGEEVTVAFHDQKKQAVADAQGRWMVRLDPMPASATPSELRVSGSSSQAMAIHNVVVGEVWFCAGQSNMAWTVQNALNPREELAAADHPMIRHFRVRFASSQTPVDMADRLGAWQPAAAGTPHGGDRPTMTRAFSAVAYFFAREIHRELGVPVGVINSSQGGTLIEAWTAVDTLRATSCWDGIEARWQQRLAEYPAAMAKHQQQLAQWEKAAADARAQGKPEPRRPRAPQGPDSRWMPGGLYNGMVAPVTSYAVRGVLWYQGEANAVRHQEYPELIRAMITQWRRDFKREDLPFYFVQLPNVTMRLDRTEQTWAYQREAQATALALPHTGMAVTIDVGEATTVHPPNKQAVGRRLALVALARTYGRDVQDSGPVFREASVEGASMRVSLDHADGLALRSTGGDDSGFELAGEDRHFHPAAAVVEGATLRVTSPRVSEPVAVRYAWRNNPPVSLYNAAGLPASPFRSDNWSQGNDAASGDLELE